MSTATKEQEKGSTENNKINVKIGMLSDVEVGKTSLMVKLYYDPWFDLLNELQIIRNCFEKGVTFLEKDIKIANNDISLLIWDMGGQKEFMAMLDVVCLDSVALLFMFDLSRKATLRSVKDWYIHSKKYNKKALPFLIGTKYDKFIELPDEEQEEITDMARKFANKMKAPLIYCSAKESINVKKLFKLVLSKIFDLDPNLQKISEAGAPLLEWEE